MVKARDTRVSVVKCVDYQADLVFAAVKRSVDLLGGITSFIRPGSRVLVKPNLLMASSIESAVTTHPEVVRAVIKLLKEIKCDLILGDAPSVWGKQIENLDEIYRCSGLKKVCQEEGVSLVDFDKRRWRKKFPLTVWLDDCDCFVNIPKFKTHGLTLLTGAVKNLFGLVSGTYKTEIHKNHFQTADFSRVLVDIYQEARPALTVVDGVIAMEGDGPGTSGTPRQTGLIISGDDCAAVDGVLAMLMGVNPSDVGIIKEAVSRGLMDKKMDNVSVLGEKISEVAGRPFLLPSTSLLRKSLPPLVMELAKRLIKYYPCVEHDKCIKCATCIKACPGKAIYMKADQIRFDYSKCIACFCCQETCPANAISMKKSFVAKMVGL
jgi:uncharacterized protein (DUF362 family)/Pyruvate/2-oxoacid:ferredoxin oxidoreductase delta subunit